MLSVLYVYQIIRLLLLVNCITLLLINFVQYIVLWCIEY
jgi:hypothetical protein